MNLLLMQDQYFEGHIVLGTCARACIIIISPVSEGSGDVMVLRRSHPPPATRRPQWC